ncbi:type IV toxin-antitoxin system AbiEi family antitoxin [Cellulosimicrobium marinum]|uniref:type IV toxin-antitoxin system AbiEi family antitoxin n=1 Tax=Cellulosimicrobium marinum TaxID=1638992 RepID=UPI001E3335A3|nr:type IV toxin-antitoxin system AbiEi family antitoxin [Cellulosimicrobium marinum]MCB7135023.1 hypothetical protein [Cellulosimicrobium marinum]
MPAIDEIDERFEEIGRALRGDRMSVYRDGPRATVELDGLAVSRRWVWGDESAWAAIANGTDEYQDVVVIDSRIPAHAAVTARRRGVWFVDACGNLYVEAPGIRVDIRGRRPPGGRSATKRTVRARETNLMSARRAQVVFCLLAWPELVTSSVRSIADAAGVSISLAHSVVATLTDEKHLVPGTSKLFRKDELLDQWTAAYPLGLARSLELGQFVGEPLVEPWAAAFGEHVQVSGEVAAEGLRGPGLVLYVPKIDTRAVVESRWRRPEPGASGNIVVRRRFWNEPEATFHPHAEGDGPRSAPLPLVYADLLASHESRQREVALAMRGVVLGRGAC